MSRCTFNPISLSDRKKAAKIWKEVNAKSNLTEKQKTDEFINRLQAEFINSSDVVMRLADSFGIGLSFDNNNRPIVIYNKDSLQDVKKDKSGRIPLTTKLSKSTLSNEVDFDSLWYNNLNARTKFIKDFSDNMVEASLWNRENNVWHDGNATSYPYGNRSEMTEVNANIVRLKCKAIERIMRATKSDAEYKESYQNLFYNHIINGEKIKDDAFKVLVLDAINAANSYLQSNIDENGIIQDTDILSDYTLLRYFDYLVDKYTPFIKVKPVYKNTESFKKYEYTGGTVDHFFNFSTDESADITEQASDLAGIILDYIPWINNVGAEIQGSSVGVGVFQHIVSSLKSAMKNRKFKDGKDYKDILTKQLASKQRFLEFLQDYKNEVRPSETKYYTPFIYELNSIMKYIFNENTNDDVFNMFFNMMMKQEQSDYVEVEYNNLKKRISASLISSKSYNDNGFMLANILTSTRSNIDFAEHFESLGINNPLSPNKYTIDFGDGKTIKFTLSSTSTDIYSIELQDDDIQISLSDLIDQCNKFYQAGFPKQAFLDYYNKSENQGAKDFAAFFITGLINVGKDKNIPELDDFYPYRGYSLKNLATACGVVYGQGKSSTYKNNQGNQIPANQLGCMAEKTDMIMQLIKEHAEANEKNDSGKINPYTVTNILINNPNFFNGVARVGGCDINGIKKSSTSLTYNELQNIALLYKFIDPIGRKNEDLALQPTTFSDKSTQFDVLINPDNYLFLNNIMDVQTKGDRNTILFNDDKPLTLREALKEYLSNPDSVLSNNIYNSLKTYLWHTFAAKTFIRTKNVFLDYWKAFEGNKTILSILGTNLNNGAFTDDPSMWMTDDTSYKDGKWTLDNKMRIANQMLINIDNVLKKLQQKGFNESYISRQFFNQGLDFIQNIHYEANKDKVMFVNTTDMQATKFTESSFSDYIEFQQDVMARSMYKGGVEIIKDYIPSWLKRCDWIRDKNHNSPWFNQRNQMFFRRKKSIIDKKQHVTDINASSEQDQSNNPEQDKAKMSKDEYIVNPILKIYSIVNAIFANDFNELHIGDPNIHGAKVTEDELSAIDKKVEEDYQPSDVDTMKQVMRYSRMRSARIVTQNKRAVPETTTVHSYLHGGTYHIPSTVKMALIDSVRGNTHLPYGEEQDMASQDGGAWSITYARYLENWSLEDAAGGRDRKTILPGMKSDYMGAQLGKWAIFDMDNERRRMGYNSSSSIENLVRKATSLKWGDNVDLDSVLTALANTYLKRSSKFFFKDIDGRYGSPNNYYLISNIENVGNGIIEYNLVDAKLDGSVDHNSSKSFQRKINSLYDIDQVLGGAFVMEYNNDFKKLVYTEKANEFIARFICENNLKDQFIYYIADKEAVKVGITNVNTIEDYRNPDVELMYTNVSTMFSGLIMNAEHESDATVSEMSQMINLLDQNGVMHDEVYQLYEEIGRIVDEALKPYTDGIDAGTNNDKLYRLIGKSLVESFKKNDRDTIDLAKSFVALANKSLSEAHIEYRLPFSAASINNNFIATISSDIVKNVIRRRYYGMQGVLTPSYDMIMTYKDANGQTYLFDEYVKVLSDKYYNSYTFNNIKPWWKQLMEDEYLIDKSGNTVDNPLIQYKQRNELQFGDTIFVNGQAIRIDSIELYDKYKHTEMLDSDFIKVHRGYPRNLGQCELTYTVDYNGTKKTFDEYSLDSNRIAFKLRQSKGVFTIDDAIALGAKVDTLGNIVEDGKDSLYMRLRRIMYPDVNDITPLIGADRSILIKKMEKETQRMLRLLANTRNESKELNRMLPMQFSWKTPNDDSNYVADELCGVTNLTFNPFEIIMSKQHSVEFGLKPGDTLNDILAQEEKHQNDGKGYFYKSIESSFEKEKLSESHLDICDAVIWIDEKPIMVKVLPNKQDKDMPISQRIDSAMYNMNKKAPDEDKLTLSQLSNDFNVINNTLYYGDVEFMPSDLLKTYRVYNNSIDYNLLVVDNWSDFNKILYNSNVRFFKRKYNSITFDKIKNRLPDHITNYRMANMNEENKFEQKMIDMGRDRYKAFLKSLEMLGTRIPSSSMQSFSVMKVVAQVDSGLNDVYVPTAINLISGSDFKPSILKSLNFVNCWEA